jgi:hypothetical protein
MTERVTLLNIYQSKTSPLNQLKMMKSDSLVPSLILQMQLLIFGQVHCLEKLSWREITE